jgi:phenylalanyl-tRNA synthetase alpha chain
LTLLIDRIVHLPIFDDFDIVETPEIVWVKETFDIFDFAPNHPVRSKSDTYYVTEDTILRTHTTVLWYYYLLYPWIKEKLEKEWEIKALSRWKVYRKDEIDRSHYPVFHQIDGVYICEKKRKYMGKEDLIDVLVAMITWIFWSDVEYRISDDTFPYTDPSLQIEVKFGDNWLELLWAWIVKGSVLDNLGIDSKKYNGRAFGPGIERYVMLKMMIPDIRILRSQDERITKQRGTIDTIYQEVSKYPSTYRDISFILSSSINLNQYYEIVRDLWWDLVEEVKLLDTYRNTEKFWADKVSYTFRIIYRSNERTLLNDEINDIQSKIRQETEKLLWAELR